ncbi:MAG: 4Fe-4S binding protein [Arenicellales bacterium]|nr:4Fe-4S binding protein [Arenicellales bacterium]
MTTTLIESNGYAGEPLALVANTTDGTARRDALSLLRDSEHTPTSVVSYRSQGSVLVHCSGGPDSTVIDRLTETGLRCTVLFSRANLKGVSIEKWQGNIDQVEGKVTEFGGHLGEFRIVLEHPEGPVNVARLVGLGKDSFDLVLDLSDNKLMQQDVPPIGYYAPESEQDVSEVISELPSMIGEFDKPKFFDLNPNICAHTSRGVVGCTRCLDVCPTQAITPDESSVKVDPYLCQGIGVCTTVCPTGAITYSFPRVSDLLDDLRRVLHRYHDEKGRQPVLLFHDEENGKIWLRSVIDSLPENLIPIEVENIASVGMDIWLSCLAYGAHHVLLLATDQLTLGVSSAIDREIELTQTILGAMGYPRDRITLLKPAGGHQLLDCLPGAFGEQIVPSAGFAAFNEKRTTLRLALDHFYEHAPKTRKTVALRAGSPFGRIKVDKQACTLCMSCAAVCPTAAITDGAGLPRLMFIENNCVQCGMCETACPEDAIELEARFNFDADDRDNVRIMYEEEPFNCTKCGKPFSTKSMMSKMREKLKGHWMYQDAAQRRRLEMCENCRIEDMYLTSGGMDPYEKADKPTGSKV